MTSLDRPLADARRNLLDLTLRNRLINHRPSLKRSLRIVDELSVEIYHRLVLKEKAMWFRPAAEVEADGVTAGASAPPTSGHEPSAGTAGESPDEPTPQPLAENGADEDVTRVDEPPADEPAMPSAPEQPAGSQGAVRTEQPEPEDSSAVVGPEAAALGLASASPRLHPPEDDARAAGDRPAARDASSPTAAFDPPAGSPTQPTDDPNRANPTENGTGENGSEASDSLWALDEPDAPVAERHRDRYLQTDVKAGQLQKRLFYIHQQARSVLEEQGYTVLYLALGFLAWREGDREPIRRAPLLLIPVDLERPKVGTAFKVRWTREEMQTNISLEARLAELGVALPAFEMPEEKEGIGDYLTAVARAVSSRPGWEVVGEIVLDFFSFTRFVMYRDLDPTTWPRDRAPAAHGLLRSILVPGEASAPQEGFQENDVDRTLDTRKVYHVMDADPSQIAVIEDVKAGQNLVVEGPPGTGKSQTITNVIAELLACGKSVLFVSEKMAALEVVKRRLDQVGLGAYCLELHSRKSRKREVLDELKRTLAAPRARAVSFEAEFEKLDHLRGELNGYAAALAEPVGTSDITPFELFARVEEARAHFAAADRKMPRVTLEGVASVETRDLAATQAHLETLSDTLELVHPVTDHPWRGSRPGTVLPADEEAIAHALDALHHALDTLGVRSQELASLSAQRAPGCPADLPTTLDAARLLLEPCPVARENLLDARWDHENLAAAQVVDRVAAYRHRRTQVLGRFRPAVLEEDVTGMLEDFQRLAPSLFRIFSSRYRALKRQIIALYLVRPPRDRLEWSLDLENARKALALRAEVREVDAVGRDHFGPAWQGEESEPESLRKAQAWLGTFRGHLRDGRFSEATVDRVLQGVDRAALVPAIDALEEAQQRFQSTRQELATRVGLDFPAVFGQDPDEVSFTDLETRVRMWRAEIKALQAWSRFVAAADVGRSTVARPLIEFLETNDLAPEDLLPAFGGNVADALLGEAFSRRPALAHFVGVLHEKKIASFRELDLALIQANRQRLASLLSERRPSIAGGASPSSEVGVLLGEFNRKRGHMPIRQLMKRAGSLIQRIKPCFMMSPLSIAQFLAPETARFDVVVFDEASQVRPEDALGALLRGAQVVVMGDTRQLPPTSFFDHLLEETAGDEDAAERAASLTDIESILHQCRRSFPARTLRWHYRSRHESLIAVSNEVFYESQLRIYPSPFHHAPHLGLQFRHVPEARYDRGRTGCNREEARIVALAALDHVQHHPEQSLGIGAFNVRQQQAVLEEVERLLRQHPELEPRFTGGPEPFFVKNLETIQGDERDVMFLSIGFGFDESGKFYRNFGPLNHDGGERRLNVLITRARQRCVVFANFRGEELRLDESTPTGVRALRDYLVFAETREHQAAASGPEQGPSSRFEKTVAGWFTDRGIPVRSRVGCAGFRVDLAVVDDRDPGRYRLGIECDAEKYHAAPVARDRDRLRAQILENLGWQLVRVWSTDWYRNRTEAEERLGAVVEETLAAASEEVTPEETAGEACHGASDASAENLQTGDDGQTVDDGQTGETGEDGQAGKTGEDGQTDENGDDGKTDDDGQTDEDGQAGKTGQTGKNGDDGQADDDGKNGDDGQADDDGENDDDGQAGENGQTGETMETTRPLLPGSTSSPSSDSQTANASDADGAPEERESAGLTEPDGSRTRTTTARPTKPANVEPVVFTPGDPLEEGVPDYALCESLGIPVQGDLTQQTTETLARAVEAVVSVEGPVHLENVVRRIRTLWGLKRAGERVIETLEAAMDHAVALGQVRREGFFLFPPTMTDIPIRRRGPDAPRKMERIADVELEAAVQRVLEVQYATPAEDLVHRTARLIGFPVTTASIRARLSTVVERLVARGHLERRPGGKIDLKGRP